MRTQSTGRTVRILGDRCRALRIQLGLSREALSGLSHGVDALSVATIKRAELGHPIYPSSAGALARVLGTTVDSLLYGEAGKSAWPHVAGDQPSVAVLPFRATNGDQDVARFGEGLAADVTYRLASFWFPVIARASSFRMSVDAPCGEVGALLGADYLVEGSLQAADGRFRLVVSLMRTVDGHQVWVNRYDSQLANVLAVQAELATDIGSQIGATMLAIEGARLAAADVHDLNAWALGLRSTWHLHRLNAADNREARACAERALACDHLLTLPRYVTVLSHQQDLVHQWSADHRDTLRQMHAACIEFERSAPGDPLMLVATAYGYVARGERAEAQERLEAALDRDANFVRAHSLYGQVLAMRGQADQALHELELALTLSPRDPARWTVLIATALAHFVAGRYERSVEFAKQALLEQPAAPFNYGVLASSQAHAGDLAAARCTLQALSSAVAHSRPLPLRRFCPALSKRSRSASSPDCIWRGSKARFSKDEMAQQQQPFMILYCGANPVEKSSNHIDLGKEFQGIEDAVEGSSFHLYPDYATSPSRLLRLLDRHKPAIVHFGLHGMRAEATSPSATRRDFAATHDSEGGLLLIEKDGHPVVLNAAKLQRMLKLCRRRTRCVVLSACHSDHVAYVLVQDIDHVVGMKAAISDAGAIAFSNAFYRSLAQGKTFREAVEFARCALQDDEAQLPILLQRPGLENDGPRPVPWWVRLIGELEGLRAFVLSALLGVMSVALLASGYGPLVSETRVALMELRHSVSPLEPSDRLRVVLIDAQSELALKTSREAGMGLGAFGSAWRTLFALALDRLSAAGAAVVAFDVAFQEEPRTKLETLGTAALAHSIRRAAERGTSVVVTALERNSSTGQPQVASSLREALRIAQPDGRCAIAHPCIGKPARGPSVPLLPLLLDGKPPSFSLSLCAYALAERTLPSWSPEAGQVFLTREYAASVAFTGLERDPNAEACGMARAGEGAVQRVLAPFARDIMRKSPRVLPFETVVGPQSELDVAGKIVLIGQRDVVPDLVLDDAAPDEKPLWGVSAHTAAIDALLQDGGLMTVVPPVCQMAWVCLLCVLTLGSRSQLIARSRWVRRGSVLLLGVANAAICIFGAAHYGLLTDPGNHMLAMLCAYGIAATVESHRRLAFS